MTFLLPGYEVERRLGRGSTGEVWLARESATGEMVALKRLIPGAAGAGDAISAAWLQREAALLAGVTHEHVVALRATVPTADGLVLVLEYAAGGSLAQLLSARGRLTPGELVTVGAPLAQALAELHARGLVHGDVTPGNVLFTAAGKPLLSDLGVAVLLDERPLEIGATAGFADPGALDGEPPSAASDVFGLAAVCFAALVGEPPQPGGCSSRAGAAPVQGAVRCLVSLAETIAGALAPQRADRPDAASFGRLLFDACAPEPVRLVRTDATHPFGGPLFDSSQPPTHRVAVARPVLATAATPPAATSLRARLVIRLQSIPTRLVRRALVSAVAALLLTGAVLVGTWWAGREPAPGAQVDSDRTSQPRPPASLSAPAPPSPKAVGGAVAAPSSTSADDWREAVAELDQVRDAAFAARDAAALARVYAPGSAALATDRASVDALTSAGLRVQGLELRLLDVQPVTVSADGVTLEVVDELPPYRLVGADGAVRQLPGRDRATWRITLVAGEPGGWRISSIVQAS